MPDPVEDNGSDTAADLSAAAPNDDASSASSASSSSISAYAVQTPKKKAKLIVKNKSAKKTTVSSSRPRTVAQREAMKKPGTTPSIFAYINLPVGRPPKSKAPETSTTAADAEVASSAADLPPPPQSDKKSRSSRGSYNSYDGGEFKAAKSAVLAHLAVNSDVAAAIKAVAPLYPTILLKRQTVNSWLKKMKNDSISEMNGDDKHKTLVEYDRHVATDVDDHKPKGVLTSSADREFLQSVIKARDDRNAGMPRKEIISIIAELANTNMKTAENHLDYLIRSKKLPELRNSGRVVRAQPTTTNRTAVTTEKLLRTHASQEEGELNYHHYLTKNHLKLL